MTCSFGIQVEKYIAILQGGLPSQKGKQDREKLTMKNMVLGPQARNGFWEHGAKERLRRSMGTSEDATNGGVVLLRSISEHVPGLPGQ